MKKYNYFLSVLLVPAIIMQAGTGTTTCPAGTGGSTPPTLALPGSVTGVQTFSYTTTTLYNFLVSSATSGPFTQGQTYSAWCTNPVGAVPGGGAGPAPDYKVTKPEDPKNTSGSAMYTPINTYSIAGAGGANYGTPGYTYTYDSSGNGSFTGTQLSLTAEWSAVNWILNNPMGVTPGLSPTPSDVQAAIWQLLYSSQGPFITYSGLSGSVLTGNSWLLYKDALANGLSFIPVTGQSVGVLMYPTTATSLTQGYQGFIIPVPVVCTTAAGSATLTKTSTVSTSGANAFQLVTYTYTVTNTSKTTTLGNINIVDDNGTPNYPEDDYTVPVPANTTIAPLSSYSISTTVYLPISLFYQSGTHSAFDTLIPQVVPVPAGAAKGTLPSLLLTYLIDTDVTDNSYGSNYSAGWTGNGGHTFAELEAGYAEFAFYNSLGMTMSDFNVNYINPVAGKPSNYGSTIGQIFTGGTNPGTGPISYLSSTLADNLNDSPQYNHDTVNSPVAGSPNWIFTAGYKVLVNEAIFGMFNSSFSVSVKKNYLAATETSFSGKCGSPQSFTYTPTVYGTSITSTAYLCANVCGCSTVVHAKACLTVKVCGSPQPTCNNPGAHICQNPVHCSCTCAQCTAGNHGSCTASKKCTPPVCSCTCAQCKAGNHASCTKVGCTDPTCHANNCNHNTVQCTIASKPVTYCW